MEIPKGVYTYRYLVDDIWYNDPLQVRVADDGYGTKISAIKLKKDLVIYMVSPKKQEKDIYQDLGGSCNLLYR